MHGTHTGTTELSPGAAAPGPGGAPAEVAARKGPGAVPEEGGLPRAAAAGEKLTRANRQRRRRRRAVLGSAAMAILFAAGLVMHRWWVWSQTWVQTDNAYAAAHLHTISSRIAGTVSEVLVEENQWVEAGAPLARLDPRDFDIRREQALARLAQGRAEVQQARAAVAQARAQAVREAARARRARLDLERATALFQDKTGAISRQEFDQAEAESAAAEAARTAAESLVTSAEATVEAAQAQLKVLEANLHEADLQRSYAEIPAPVSGRVGRKNLEAGNRVQPGQALAALVQNDVWVTANFKETQLSGVRPGQPARVRFDAFPGRVFAARVESLSPASGSQFALLPPDNATGNFTRIVQRVPVRIVFEPGSLGDCAGRVLPGMSAVVDIRVRGGK